MFIMLYYVNSINICVILKQKGQSSEEELEECAWGENETEIDRVDTLRTPLAELVGHIGVVVAADWLPGGEQV